MVHEEQTSPLTEDSDHLLTHCLQIGAEGGDRERDLLQNPSVDRLALALSSPLDGTGESPKIAASLLSMTVF